ncbi:hypothetical protein K227x_06160 [Rubripirellula lacrimiformis]|uniref:Glycoamylase-like domain-containing protein n=1 Tax=Rubripirellula lacrimiformis TaxID=1930273 RepID=A0A517N534_9BACT|nr:glucoamylase family protein [Rubripirellula lacrimiformis]QDT02243.1 hypothetical protein K227x_06160 [Rubripirellula lacrimiformis]
MKRRLFLAAGLVTAASRLHHAGSHSMAGDRSRDPQQAFNAQDAWTLAMERDKAEFLSDVGRRCYRYLVEAAHPKTGLVADRGRTDGSQFSDCASTAACGFALAGHGVAANQGWVDRPSAKEHVRRMLGSLLELAQHERGFVYHFIDRGTGKRAMRCEASTIDTALMVAGAMHASQVFADDADIVSMAGALYRRVEWRSMLGDNGCLHMGWTPESGMISHQWDTFSELTILVLLAIGAPTHSIPGECWNAWRRTKTLHHNGQPFLSYPPLFVHQYPHAFFDFRNVVSPSGRSYWQNSLTAHQAQIAYLKSLSQQSASLGHYGDDLWGITSSDSVAGYRDWGGPYEDGVTRPERGIDGTVVPSAAGGALATVPEQSLRTLIYQRDHYGQKVYGRYGFTNAFNPATGWIGSDVIGIDTGITLLSAANLTNEGVWKPFMQHHAAQRALDRAGFRATDVEALS